MGRLGQQGKMYLFVIILPSKLVIPAKFSQRLTIYLLVLTTQTRPFARPVPAAALGQLEMFFFFLCTPHSFTLLAKRVSLADLSCGVIPCEPHPGECLLTEVLSTE